jgi:TolA protein
LEKVEIAKPIEKDTTKETKKAESAEKRQDSQALLEAKLAAIKKELESRKKNAAKPQLASSSSENSGNSEAGNMDPELLRWLENVKTRINANWSVFGEHQIDKSTLISIQVAHDGRLQNASIERGSGDDIFDKSAMRAVMQAAPFPPIPAGFGDRIKRAGGLALRFTPRGMQ